MYRFFKVLMKAALLSLVFIGFINVNAFAENENIYHPLSMGKVTVAAAKGLNMRGGPGINYKIIKVLPYGMSFKVLEEKDGWYRVDDTGWICAHYAKPYEAIKKTAYLTFDDGPSLNNTPKILDILKTYQINATFFVNGLGKKELYQRIVAEGHVIGNHTYSHDYKKVYSSVSDFKNEVEKLNDFLEQVCGIRPEILRFPGGSNNTVSRKYGGSKIMKKLCAVALHEIGYQYFDWNVSSNDATSYRANKNYLVQSVLKNARYTDRAIILMHDASPKITTVAALPEVIEGLINLGFDFDVLTKDTPGIHFESPE